MIWMKRLLFTALYFLLIFGVLRFTNISAIAILPITIAFSGVIAKNGVLAALDKYFHD
ncbi:hypothetical protein [Candidatus Enterococcus leclercqii]|uniref:hypothetical protein n=1 Tax=Enterococcus TaxID=1350 RepID=UPI00137AEF1E|nr:hypothetical protein [Enterococcus sp. CU9D]